MIDLQMKQMEFKMMASMQGGGSGGGGQVPAQHQSAAGSGSGAATAPAVAGAGAGASTATAEVWTSWALRALIMRRADSAGATADGYVFDFTERGKLIDALADKEKKKVLEMYVDVVRHAPGVSVAGDTIPEAALCQFRLCVDHTFLGA
jgi:hypothetical protein